MLNNEENFTSTDVTIVEEENIKPKEKRVNVEIHHPPKNDTSKSGNKPNITRPSLSPHDNRKSHKKETGAKGKRHTASGVSVSGKNSK